MDRLGSPHQLGYVVKDLRAALDHWVAVVGVGPWYVFDPFPVERFAHRGAAGHPDLTIGLAYSGELQIELIEQRCDTPTMYREFLAAGHEGLQHLGFFLDDFAGAVDLAHRRGWALGQEGSAAGTHFAYYDTSLDRDRVASHPGTVVELVDLPVARQGFFGHLRDLAATWDGADPVRPVG